MSLGRGFLRGFKWFLKGVGKGFCRALRIVFVGGWSLFSIWVEKFKKKRLLTVFLKFKVFGNYFNCFNNSTFFVIFLNFFFIFQLVFFLNFLDLSNFFKKLGTENINGIFISRKKLKKEQKFEKRKKKE